MVSGVTPTAPLVLPLYLHDASWHWELTFCHCASPCQGAVLPCLSVLLLRTLYHRQDSPGAPQECFYYICVFQSIDLTGPQHPAFPETPNSLDTISMSMKAIMYIYFFTYRILIEQLSFLSLISFAHCASSLGIVHKITMEYC